MGHQTVQYCTYKKNEAGPLGSSFFHTWNVTKTNKSEKNNGVPHHMATSRTMISFNI